MVWAWIQGEISVNGCERVAREWSAGGSPAKRDGISAVQRRRWGLLWGSARALVLAAGFVKEEIRVC